MRPEWSDFGFTVCYSNLVFLFDANAWQLPGCYQIQGYMLIADKYDFKSNISKYKGKY